VSQGEYDGVEARIENAGTISGLGTVIAQQHVRHPLDGELLQ
jgi:hypothetical protein